VRRLDLGNQKITLKHGEIKNLDMPPMTMVFDAKALPKAQLSDLKVGDKLRFQAAMVDGRAQLTAIQR
jgi:Cu(I)/Ag(I) efflux system protein CusF